MGDRELTLSGEMAPETAPITAICIVADKNKVPKGFTVVTKSFDDSSDADLWKESAFSLFSRPVRYLCYSRQTNSGGLPSAVSVVTDITVVKDSDPITHGFIAIDYTADSREKSLRKRFLCVKAQPREDVVDAVGEIIVLNKTKKTPKDFTLAGEVDGAMICFRMVVIPPTFGISHSASDRALTENRQIGLYPQISGAGMSGTQSTPALNKVDMHPPINAFTIKGACPPVRGIEDVPFKINPSLQAGKPANENELPSFGFDISKLDSDEFTYRFNLERSTLSSA